MDHVVSQPVAVVAFCASVPVVLSLFTYGAIQPTVCEPRQICTFE